MLPSNDNNGDTSPTGAPLYHQQLLKAVEGLGLGGLAVANDNKRKRTVTQPRDEKGRFVKAVANTAAPASVVVTNPVININNAPTATPEKQINTDAFMKGLDKYLNERHGRVKSPLVGGIGNILPADKEPLPLSPEEEIKTAPKETLVGNTSLAKTITTVFGRLTQKFDELISIQKQQLDIEENAEDEKRQKEMETKSEPKGDVFGKSVKKGTDLASRQVGEKMADRIVETTDKKKKSGLGFLGKLISGGEEVAAGGELLGGLALGGGIIATAGVLDSKDSPINSAKLHNMIGDKLDKYKKDNYNKGGLAGAGAHLINDYEGVKDYIADSSAGKSVGKVLNTPITDLAKKAGNWVKGEFDKSKDLLDFAIKKGIKDKKELAAFLAQASTETGGFKWMHELGNSKYFSKYDGRKDLGNSQAGDGYKYRGRGFVQLTGRANYEAVGKKLGIDLVNHPELAEDPEVAKQIYYYYWQTRVKKKTSNFDDTVTVTKAINGGLNGLASRKENYSKYSALINSANDQGLKAEIIPTKQKPLPSSPTKLAQAANKEGLQVQYQGAKSNSTQTSAKLKQAAKANTQTQNQTAAGAPVAPVIVTVPQQVASSGSSSPMVSGGVPNPSADLASIADHFNVS